MREKKAQHWAWGLGLGCVAWLIATAGVAQDAVTIQGEVVDMACYMAKGSKGAAHKSCAQLCAKRGVPLGLLTDQGELYLLVDDHDNAAAYEAVKKLAGERAEVVGRKFVKQGVAGIVVGGAKGL